MTDEPQNLEEYIQEQDSIITESWNKLENGPVTPTNSAGSLLSAIEIASRNKATALGINIEKIERKESYKDRNLAVQLAAVLAHRLGYKIGVQNDLKHKNLPVLYIELPNGQVSWHIPNDEAIVEFPFFQGSWDKHTREDKRQRVKDYLYDAENEWYNE